MDLLRKVWAVRTHVWAWLPLMDSVQPQARVPVRLLYACSQPRPSSLLLLHLFLPLNRPSP